MRQCYISYQGYPPCNCITQTSEGPKPSCKAGLMVKNGEIYRLIYDIVLSRPEDYLSIYQSACNHSCLKCHSWYFTQIARGKWLKPEDIVKEALDYREQVTVWEPKHRAI